MDSFEKAVIELVSIARQQIASKYDPGKPDYKAYHNSAHTTQVVEAAHILTELALQKRKITSREAQLCVLAAGFHDVIHEGDSEKDNEELSAEFVAALMKNYKEFTTQDVKHVRHMILATKCSQKYPKIIQTPLPHDYSSKLLCDADMSSFGKPFDEFYESALALFKELHTKEIVPSEMSRYLELEKTLLSNHSFWTEEATVLFPHTAENHRRLTTQTNMK
jgi:predicted metal-dependent HD superfamily phosphohydrolase